jgi:site-specific DNA recombinase
MKSCFGYVRVSTAKQGEGLSLEAQREAIEHFARRNSLSVTQWFEEKETAAKSGRPVFDGMVKSLERGEASSLIIHKIDRSARNFRDWAKIGELSDQGIDVHFATETLDFRSRGGRLAADIQAVIAADYIRNLREETLKGMNGRLKQGFYPWKAPIGYLDNGGGKAKTIDPVRGPLIRECFELYSGKQHSVRSLVEYMDEKGLRTENCNTVTKTGMENILKNPFYVGTIRVRSSGMTYPGIHEPLIPQSLFNRVQDVRLGRHHKKVTRHNHLYRGLFVCSVCKKAMIPEFQKGHVYYRCHGQSCPRTCVREEGLGIAVTDTLSFAALTDEDATFLTAEMTKWIAERHTSDTNKNITLQIGALEAKLDRLTDLLVEKTIDTDTYHQKRADTLAAIARLKEQVQSQKTMPTQADTAEFLELIKNLAGQYQIANPAEKREMVSLFTSNRTVTGKNVCVEPSEWLLRTRETVRVLCGALHRPRNRSILILLAEQFSTLHKQITEANLLLGHLGREHPQVQYSRDGQGHFSAP